MDPSEAFQKSYKEYKIFGVLKTPCIQDLSEFISNMDDRKKSTNKLLYFQNIKRAESVINCFLGIAWVVCVTLNLIYIYTGNIADYMNHNSYLPLISFSFVAV